MGNSNFLSPLLLIIIIIISTISYEFYTYSRIPVEISIFPSVTNPQSTNLNNLNNLNNVNHCNAYDRGYIHNHQWKSWNNGICDNHTIDIIQEIKDHLNSNVSKLEYLFNKTIVLIGDSLDRNTVNWLCYEFKEYGSQGSYGSFYFNETGWTLCKKWQGCPNMCYFPQLDLHILNSFTVGVDVDDSLRPRLSHHIPPNQSLNYKARIIEELYPFINNVLKRKPNMISFTSGFWDMMFWTRQIYTENINAIDFDILNSERLNHFTDVIKTEIIPSLTEFFPDAKVYWRSLPPTPAENTVKDDRWAFNDLKDWKNITGEPKTFRNSYINGLNMAVSQMITLDYKQFVGILDYHRIVFGELEWSDAVHPAGNGMRAIVNRMLYEFKYEL